MTAAAPDAPLATFLLRLVVLTTGLRAALAILLPLASASARRSWPLHGLQEHPSRTSLAASLVLLGAAGLLGRRERPPTDEDSNATLAGGDPAEGAPEL